MKEIKAIIQPYMLDAVCDSLGQIEGLPGITVSQVMGFGRTRPVDGRPPAEEGARAFAHESKVEVVVTDEMASVVVATITAAAHTGKLGDGKIFVSEVSDVVRICTGARGEAAI